MTGVLIRRGKFRHRQTQRGEHHVKTQRHTEGRQPCEDGGYCKPKNTWGCELWEEARKDPPLEVLKEAWPCQHLNLGLLGSRTVRE